MKAILTTILLTLLATATYSQNTTRIDISGADSTAVITEHKAGFKSIYTYKGTPIQEKELLKILLMNPASMKEAKKAKQNLIFGQCVTFGCSFAFGYYLAQSLLDKPKWGLVAASAGTFLIAGFSISNSYYYRLGRAINLYNGEHGSGKRSSSGQISFGLTPGGIGILVSL